MPRYSLRIGGKKVPLATTERRLSDAVGKRLASSDPQTNVDSTGGTTGYSFSGQDIDFEDLRDIKDMRDSGGQVAQLMKFKALLHFGEGAEFHVEDDEATEQVVDGTDMTLSEWLETEAFPHLDLLVLDMGEDALWYPAAVGEILETQAGEFGEFLPAEPWTILPVTNDRGQIVAWRQRTVSDGGTQEQTLPAEDIVNIVLNKRSARDKTGISEVLRNREEIAAFQENENAIRQAIELHGFPQRHVKVGKEDGAPVRDDDLRRVRTIFDPRTSDANTAYFTGQDVDVETLEAEQFDYSAVHEMDMRNLTTALGLPLEAGNVGADGLGSGKPAELRFALLKLAIKANQRSFSQQFVKKVVRPVVRDYSPFDHTATITVEIDDPLEDIGEVADLINSVGDYMTNAEARRKLDLPEPEEDDVAESYRSPADVEKSEAGDPVDESPFGGMFSEDRELQDVENAALSDRRLASNVDAIALTFPPGGEVIDHDKSDWSDFLDELSKHGDVFQMWKGLQRHPEDNLESHDHATFVALEAGSDVTDIESVLEDFPGVHYQIESESVGPMDKPDGWSSENSEHALSGRDTGNRCLGGVTDETLAHAPEWDRALLEMHQGITDPDGPTDRALVSFASSGTPEFVLDRIREAVDDGSMFAQIDGIPSDQMMELRSMFKDELGQDDFTLDSITESLMDFSDMSRDDAERVARTESTSILNKSRELGYEQRGEDDELFYWTGASPGDKRQTDVCGYLIAGQGGHLENPGAFSGLPHSNGTNPFEGGTPIPMDELKELVQKAARADPEINTEPRTWTPHINCRSTFSKAPPGEVS